jgi:hypothetical protein
VPADYPSPVAEEWPDLLDIVERLVKPERAKQNIVGAKRLWWRYEKARPALRAAMAGLEQVIVIGMVSPHVSFVLAPAASVYTLNVTVIASNSVSLFAVLQSRVHEIWAREFSSTLEDRIKYSPADAFRTFPFTEGRTVPEEILLDVGIGYYTARSSVLLQRKEGLTKTYNRFHSPADRAADIQRLRELHHALDLAVLRAYGWDDLAARAVPEFLSEETEPDHRYQGRLFWPAPFRDEVLARLLDLNRARAAEEHALGLCPGTPDDSEEDQDEAA